MIWMCRWIRSNYFKVKRKAVFGEVSYDINERLAVTVGRRYFDYDGREDETAGCASRGRRCRQARLQ